jgi:UDP-N-acetylmuramoyl-L-alanyl-D-glutamate--2,6-diaminopimelate ligase
VEVLERSGDLPEVTDLRHDSRRVTPGTAFIALRGGAADGHTFLDAVVRLGAALLVLEERPAPSSPAAATPWVTVADTRVAMARLALNFYGRLTDRIPVVGITGTNGKTTTAWLTEAALAAAGFHPGLFSTVLRRWCGTEELSSMTTPEAPDLHEALARMVADGADALVMEVSSHGVAERRVDGIHFDVAAFTNLGSDHLDYHGSLDRYAGAKRELFTRLLADSPKAKGAVICTDDPFGRELAQEIAGPVLRYGLRKEHAPDLFPEHFEVRIDGISALLRIGGELVSLDSPLTGTHNLQNLLCAIGCARLLGAPTDRVVAALRKVPGIPGRLERVPNECGVAVFVDYAHTADALDNVLTGLGALATGRILTVFGCGGNRDRSKRPLMGHAAARGSDVVVITSDNPRDEEPAEIIAAAESGVTSAGFVRYREGARSGYHTEEDRALAIAWAIAHAEPGDVVLIAGKGHEQTQEIRGTKRPFDDRQVAASALAARGGVA